MINLGATKFENDILLSEPIDNIVRMTIVREFITYLTECSWTSIFLKNVQTPTGSLPLRKQNSDCIICYC